MAKFYAKLGRNTKQFIEQQKLFFTATAAEQGRINLSPKGMDSLRIIDDKTIAYVDLTGSGNETAAHIKNNGRLTIMFCSFAKAPLILRLYGQGRTIKSNDPQWKEHIALFPTYPGTRQIIILDIDSIQTSCGFSIPLYEFLGERDTLTEWANKKGEDGIKQYHQDKNQTSIDGLPTGLLED